MKQNLIVALVVITLITNVILGIELYTVLHPGTHGQVITQLNGSNVSIISKTNSSYSFSFKIKFNLKIHNNGEYTIGIKPTGFKQLYIILQFKDGKTVELTLNNTQVQIYLTHKDKDVVAFISGESYENLTEEQIINNIGLYISSDDS